MTNPRSTAEGRGLTRAQRELLELLAREWRPGGVYPRLPRANGWLELYGGEFRTAEVLARDGLIEQSNRSARITEAGRATLTREETP